VTVDQINPNNPMHSDPLSDPFFGDQGVPEFVKGIEQFNTWQFSQNKIRKPGAIERLLTLHLQFTSLASTRDSEIFYLTERICGLNVAV